MICLLLGVLALSQIRCASPTAPTVSRYRWATVYPGCSPMLPLPEISGEPTIVVQNPKDESVKLAYWPVTMADGSTQIASGTFARFGTLYLLCSWKWGA